MASEKFEVRDRFTNAVQFTAEIEVTPDMTPRVKLGLAVRWARKNDADLRGADLRDADLSGANLSGADLRVAVLRGAVLSDADLRGADLRGAVLRGADLSGADLSDADLRGAVLSGAVLSVADLSDADLRDADLSGADLRVAVLRGADLSGANLSGADLSGANLSGANLSGADLRSFKADMWMTLAQAREEVPALVTALRNGKVNGSQYEGSCACLVGTLANAAGKSYTAMFPDASSRHPAEQWFLMIREGDKPGDDSGGGFAAAKALEWAEEYCRLTGIELPEPTPAGAA
jgi:hypothetical protein